MLFHCYYEQETVRIVKKSKNIILLGGHTYGMFLLINIRIEEHLCDYELCASFHLLLQVRHLYLEICVSTDVYQFYRWKT